ncbi:MAG TPA: hypothetical protein VK131_02505, partial [Candidatus Acidoferrales bacterium]|nr:hypothetical protein [Candidatus Acidoferrales bacterium]
MLAASLPRVISGLDWNADFVSQMVIAESLGPNGGGRAIVVQIGWMWFDLLTRSLPFHRWIWEHAPYLLALGGLALLAATSYRLAGTWAAAVTAALGLSASPLVLATQAAQAFHGTTWFGGALLAWYLQRLLRVPRPAEWAAVGVVTGALVATDPMLLAVGVVPFLGAALLAARLQGRGGPALAALGACTLSVITAAGLVIAFRAGSFTGSLPAGLAQAAASGRLGYHLQVLGGGLLEVFGLGWP